MGTDAHLIAFDAPAGWENAAIEVLWELDHRWNPQIADSEINHLNALGELAPASDLTLSLFEAAANAHAITGNRFDPVQPGAAWDSVEIDPLSGWVMVHNGARVDLEIVARGFAADLVAAEILDAGATAALVNLGGDVRTTVRPDGVRWTIGVDDPRKPGALLANVALGEGAIATVTTDAWRNPAPTDTRLASVTVVANEATWAAPLAHTAIDTGPDEAIALFEKWELGALVLTENGRRLQTTMWKAYAG
jgi:FAD:protein FMN transferase